MCMKIQGEHAPLPSVADAHVNEGVLQFEALVAITFSRFP